MKNPLHTRTPGDGSPPYLIGKVAQSFRILLILATLWLTLGTRAAYAQFASTTFVLKVNRMEHYEGGVGGNCWEIGDEEYTGYAGFSDNVNGAVTWSSCQTGSANGNATYGQNAFIGSRTNAADRIDPQVDGWEDDGGGRCTWESGDDCRTGPGDRGDIFFRTAVVPSNTYNLTNQGGFGDGDFRVWYDIYWYYSGSTNAITPSCTEQSVSAASGSIRSWSVFLTAGVRYNFNTCSTTSTDRYLRLYGPDGYTIVSTADDECGSLQPAMNYTAATTGWHYLELANYPRSALTETVNLKYSIVTPSNNACSAATAIGLGSTNFYTTCATQDAPTQQCGTGGLSHPDIWYSYAATASGSLTVSNCAVNNYDSRISVYSGSCGALVYQGCSDDACGSSSSVTLNVCNGTTYYISVGGYNGNTGTGTLGLAFSASSAITAGSISGATTICAGTDPSSGFTQTAASNGTGTITYQWQQSPSGCGSWSNATPGSGNATSATFDPPALNSTTCYRRIATDACGATATAGPFTVTVNSNPVVNVPTVTQPLCDGTTGTIVVNATGGSEYSINNGSTWSANATFSGLAEGSSSTILVRTNTSPACTTAYASNPVLINNPTPVACAATTNVNPTCSGGSNGSITFPTPTGGTGTGYQFSINGGTNYFASGSFTGLAAGTYALRVRDSNGCVLTMSNVTLTAPSALVFGTINLTHPLCNNDANGQISIPSASGGTGTITYSKDNGGSYQTGSTFTGLAAGTYTLVIKDANNCTVTTTRTLTNPTVVSSSISSTVNPSCNGASTGSYTFGTTTGGSGSGYQYSNNGGAWQSGNVFSTLAAGTYQPRVRDGNGCVTTLANVVLTQPTPVTLSTVAYTSCPGVNGFATVRLTPATGGSGSGYQYRQLPNPYQGSNQFTSVPNGTTTYFEARDGNGCTTASTIAVTPLQTPTSIATGTTTSTTCTCEGENRNFWLVNGTTAIGQINPGTNNIGNVTFKACVQGAPYLVDDGTVNGFTATMGRSLEATFTAPSSGTVQITFPFTSGEVSALASASTASSSANDLVTSITDVKVTRMEGILHNCTWNTTGLTSRTPISPTSQPSVLGSPSVSFPTSGNSVYFFHGSASNTPLPVTLLSQGAKCSVEGSAVGITWVTATESNNKRFIIERSFDGAEWTQACDVPGAGTSNTQKYYACYDTDPILLTRQTWYYRITQEDFDGTTETFSTMMAVCDPGAVPESDQVTVFPNPASEYATLQTIFPTDTRVTLTLVGQSGEVIDRRIYQAGEGTTQVTLATSELPAGMYYLVLETPTKRITRTLVVTK